jgi:hypothetical protein
MAKESADAILLEKSLMVLDAGPDRQVYSVDRPV